MVRLSPVKAKRVLAESVQSTVTKSESKPSIQTTEFADKVYDACKKIPAGKVATYSTIASMIGAPKAVRAVGSALKRNPFAPIVPCHRVVASDLSLGGFQGSTDKNGCQLKKKVEMLKAEGVEFVEGLKSLKVNESFVFNAK